MRWVALHFKQGRRSSLSRPKRNQLKRKTLFLAKTCLCLPGRSPVNGDDLGKWLSSNKTALLVAKLVESGGSELPAELNGAAVGQLNRRVAGRVNG